MTGVRFPAVSRSFSPLRSIQNDSGANSGYPTGTGGKATEAWRWPLTLIYWRDHSSLCRHDIVPSYTIKSGVTLPLLSPFNVNITKTHNMRTSLTVSSFLVFVFCVINLNVFGLIKSVAIKKINWMNLRQYSVREVNYTSSLIRICHGIVKTNGQVHSGL
jgi:hypothetical protein